MPAPETLPGSVPAAARDLSDVELDELDGLLAELPEPLEPFAPIDVVALDGFLCGVLVQPVAIGADEWLPYLCGADAPNRERIATLALRRHAALNRALVEDGAFEPWLPADDEPDPEDENDPRGRVSAPSRPLLPWVAGFEAAILAFPDLLEIDDEAVMLALASIRRHLPADDDAQRKLNATLDREWPLASVDDAVDDLVAAVADLADLTHDARYAVETVRRDAPKVGRNDPCPCGSGRKYKRCHGAWR